MSRAGGGDDAHRRAGALHHALVREAPDPETHLRPSAELTRLRDFVRAKILSPAPGPR